MPTRSSLFGGLGLLLSTALPLIIASPIPLHGSYVSLDGWTLSTTVINTTSFLNEPYVSNGYIGARLPVEGVGLRIHPAIDYEGRDGVQGWPLFELRQTASIVAGFYNQQGDTKGTNFEQTGGQQVISLLPTWTSLFLTVSPSPDSPPEDWVTYRPGVELSQVKSFRQSLSLRNGVVQTNVTWSPFDPSNNGSHIQLHYTVVAHRSRPNLGLVRLDISGLTKGQQVIITDALDGAGAQRVQGEQAGSLKQNELPNAIYSSVQPFGVSDVTAWEISALEFIGLKDENYTAIGIPASVGLKDNFTSTASQSYSVSAPANGHLTVIKAVGIASTDAFNGTERSTALAAVKKAQADGWDELLEEHDEAWETIWDEGGEIVIHGANMNKNKSENKNGDNKATILDELQLTTISSLYHLLANIRDGNEGRGLGDNSIAPAGLTSDSYAGGIFWDADLWMYPSLLSLFPDYAMSINNYRSKNLDQAYKNAQQYNRSGLLYPWVAFRYGNCTGIGPCYDYEYHLNNDIALAQWQYFQTTNNKTWLEEWGYPIMKGVSEFWASHVIWNPDTNRYITLNETDPDEYANHVDNAAFTNAGLAVNFENSIQAASILGKSHEVPKNWSDIAEKITILYEPTSDVILEYDGFNATTPVKQADVVLLIYPLESDKVRDPHEDLAFYLGANSPNGPGMTYSVFSIGSAQLAYQGCEAYTYLLQSSEPYVRGPFSQFSEQATDEYSKNAGTNPAYTFLTGNGGFLQTWTHGFTGYRPHLDCFYLDPSLPPQLAPDGFTVRGMKWQGSVFDVTVQGSRTIIRRRSGKRSSKACVEIGKRNKNRGKHQLSVGETLTVGTYRSDLNGTLIPGNKAQCALKVTSKDPILPGQYALAAVDGSNATYWRPDTKSPASMTIDLGKVQTINGFHLNFNRIPPKSYSVFAGLESFDDDSNDNKHNNGSIGMKQVARVDQVEITAPYDEKTAGVVIVRLGNTSDVSLAESVKARFVRLVVEGVLTDDGTTAGATVAEIAVL